MAGGGGGDYSREAINRGTAIIRGNTVYHRTAPLLQLIRELTCERPDMLAWAGPEKAVRPCTRHLFSLAHMQFNFHWAFTKTFSQFSNQTKHKNGSVIAYLLTEWEGQIRKYLAPGHGTRMTLCWVHNSHLSPLSQ